MDSALKLKIDIRNGVSLSDGDIKERLLQSKIVERLLTESYRLDTFTGLRKLEFLLIELSVIPGTHLLDRANDMVDTFIEHTKVSEGFSLTGDIQGVLSCHNAIATLIMGRFGRVAEEKHGIDWILNYQITDRNEVCGWYGKDLFSRFGGCVGHTPCIDGLVKSLLALSEYKSSDKLVTQKLESGIDYLLEHRLYQHMESDEPLNSDIIKLFYPYAYRTNVIEILSLMKNEHRLDDSRTDQAKELVRSKKRGHYFLPEKLFMKTSFIPFEPIGKAGLWITDEINSLFE